MAGKSDYLENKVLDHILGNTAYTAPATLYFALFTSAPSDAGGGGGTEPVEARGGGTSIPPPLPITGGSTGESCELVVLSAMADFT